MISFLSKKSPTDSKVPLPGGVVSTIGGTSAGVSAVVVGPAESDDPGDGTTASDGRRLGCGCFLVMGTKNP